MLFRKTKVIQVLNEKTGIIEEDLKCEKCRYNLRTMKMGELCPECGFAVCESVELCNARQMMPRHVKMIRVGEGFATTSMIGFALLIIAFFLNILYPPYSWTFRIVIILTALCALITMCAFILAIIFFVYGFILKRQDKCDFCEL